MYVKSLGQGQVQFQGDEASTAAFFYEVSQSQASHQRTHHQVILDLSQSMLSQLELIKDVLTQLVKQLSNGKFPRFFSLLACNGLESYEWWMKEQPIEEAMGAIGEWHCRLEEWSGGEESPLSDALEMGLESIKEGEVSTQHHILLITDGHIYTPARSKHVEQHRCMSAALQMKQEIVYFDVLGIGPHYAQDFLVQLSEVSGSGAFYLIVTPKLVSRCVRQLVTALKNSQPIPVIIENRSYFHCQNQMHHRYPNRSYTFGPHPQLLVTFQEPLIINHRTYPVITGDIAGDHLAKFRYAYSAYLIKHKQISAAVSFIEPLHPTLAKHLETSFTSRDTEKHLHWLKQPNPSLKPPLPLTVFQLIQDLINNPFATLYYNDHPITSLRVSTTKFNLNFNIKLNEKDKKASDNDLDSVNYRTIPFVVDGHLQITELTCNLPPTLRQKYKTWGLLKKDNRLNLETLPLTDSASLFNVTKKQIAQELHEIKTLTQHQKILKTLIQLTKKKCSRKTYGKGPSKIQSQKETFLKDYREVTVLLWELLDFDTYKAMRQGCDLYVKDDKNPEAYLTWLYAQLTMVNRRKNQVQNAVHLKRITSHLTQQQIFNTTDELVKVKCYTCWKKS